MKKLETKTVRELVELAREWGISGYSKLKKAELLKVLAKTMPGRGRNRLKQAAGTASRTARQAASKARASSSRFSAGVRKIYTRPDAASQPVKKPVEPQPEKKINPRPASSKPPKTPPVMGKPQATQHSAPAPVNADLRDHHDGRMVLLVRDPNWLYCYWDLTDTQARKLWRGANAVLRVVELQGAEGHREVQRFAVPPGARSWYIKLDTAGKTHRCELGLTGEGDDFDLLVYSNLSTSPPDRLARVLQSRYIQHKPAAPFAQGADTKQGHDKTPTLTTPGKHEEDLMLHSLADGPGLDSEAARKALAQRLEAGLASEVLQSQIHAEGSAHMQAETDNDGYWLWADADIIIYGATVPGSHVTLRDIPIPLDESGRFSARFALPDGELDMPVVGTSPRRTFRKRVRIRVERQTEADPHPVPIDRK